MRKILVLEDDRAFLSTLEDALNALNYQVKAINTSKDLYGQICDFQPDLLLMDFTLDDDNGGEICQHIKNNPEFSCLSVIIMSGYEDVLELAEKAGTDDFIQKPFDIFELDNKIEKCLNKRKDDLFNQFT